MISKLQTTKSLPKSSFIHATYRKHKLATNPKHEKAKARLREIAQANGWHVETNTQDHEWQYPEIHIPDKGVRNYRADVLISKKVGKRVVKIDLECDGEQHNGDKQRDKDRLRDSAILSEFAIPTVRFDKLDIIGRRLKNGGYYRLSEQEILEAIEKCLK